MLVHNYPWNKQVLLRLNGRFFIQTHFRRHPLTFYHRLLCYFLDHMWKQCRPSDLIPSLASCNKEKRVTSNNIYFRSGSANQEPIGQDIDCKSVLFPSLTRIRVAFCGLSNTAQKSKVPRARKTSPATAIKSVTNKLFMKSVFTLCST